jgi:hypothetical protein
LLSAVRLMEILLLELVPVQQQRTVLLIFKTTL